MSGRSKNIGTVLGRKRTFPFAKLYNSYSLFLLLLSQEGGDEDKFPEIRADLVNRCQFGRDLLSTLHFCGFPPVLCSKTVRPH